MKRRISDFKKVVLFAVLAMALTGVMAPLALAQSDAEKGEQVFRDKKCSSCHTVGGGDTAAGPDLIDVGTKRSSDWLHEILEDPGEFAASSDPEKQALVAQFGGKVMPELGLSDADVVALLAFFNSAKFKAGDVACPEPTGGNAERGRQLFTGATAQQSGGAACISCHNAGDMSSAGLGLMGGGSLAKDLTDLYDTNKTCTGDAVASLNRPGVMGVIYAGKTLTPAETADLYEYFKSISKQSPPSSTVSLFTLALIGLAFSIILLIISQLIWGKRIQGVRKRLVGGSK